MKKRFTFLTPSLKQSILVMTKISIILWCTGVFALSSGSGYSQDAKIMIPENQTISVEEVFDLIKEQTKYNFIFRSSWLQTLPKVRLKKGVIRADELLNKSLGRNYTFEFKPEYETILVIPQERVQEENQQKLITGKVTDKAGNPLTGVTV